MTYYIKLQHPESGHWGVSYKEADIGWRWCKDELPEHDEEVLALTKEYGTRLLIWNNNRDMWYNDDGTYLSEQPNVSQWCSLPEPLTENKNDE